MATRWDVIQMPNIVIVNWSTSDNLDVGYDSEYADAQYQFPTLDKAFSFIKGTNREVEPITHSWYGCMGERVIVSINGKQLPFPGEDT